MAQIVQGPPNLGESLAKGLSQGLHLGIGGLLDSKLNELNRRNEIMRTAQALQGLMPNLTSEQALQLAPAPVPLLQQFMKGRQSEQLAQQEGQTFSALANALQQQIPQPTGTQFRDQQQPNQPVMPAGSVGYQAETTPSVNIPNNLQLGVGKALPTANFLKDVQQNAIKNQMAQQNLSLKEEKQREDINKSVREFSKPYVERRDASEKNIKDYDTLIKLAQKGNLRAGATHQLLSKVGLEGFGRDFDTQLADKVMARLAQNVGSAFGGGRLTNYIEQTFQRSLPTLWNTPEGIIAISKLNQLTDEASIVKDNERKQLIKETNGRLPFNAEDIIAERSAPKIQKLEEDALKIVENSQLKSTGSIFKDLPPASQYNGKKIRDKDTGQILVSNGKSWEPA